MSFVVYFLHVCCFRRRCVFWNSLFFYRVRKAFFYFSAIWFGKFSLKQNLYPEQSALIMGESVSAACVCSKINVCTQQLCMFGVRFRLCVHRHCVDMHAGKISCIYASVFETQAWVTDCWNAGLNGSCHLLSLVSRTQRGHTVQSEQSRVTNERDISAERCDDNRDEERELVILKT